MRVYQPQLKIILTKARRRNEIAPGQAVDERYNRYEQINLTPFLADSGTVSVTKSVRQPAGTFTIGFPDQPIEGVSVYFLVEPMDMMEIRMSEGNDLPILMRGFISTVDRSITTTQDGKPQRFVTVSGHDYGKILQTIQMLYLPFMGNLTAAYINENRWFMIYGGNGDYKAKPAQEFINNALDGSINKYLSAITVTQKPQDDSGIIKRMTGEVTVSGIVSPFTPNSFVDVSLYEMLKTMMDAPVFNEIYTRDDPDAVVLVVRPIPFKSLDGQFIQGQTETLAISTEDVISVKYARSDNPVANYYWVTSSAASLSNNMDMLKYTALSGTTENFVLFDYLNSLRDIFSIRKMETQTMLWPGDYRHSDSPNEKQLTEANQDLNQWLIYRRELLAQLNKDNAIYESGNLVMRGNETIKPGNYIRLQDGENILGEVYAHTIKYVFNPFRDYLAIVEFDRGTFFYEDVRAH